jgi:hypothetical protein
MEAVSIVGRDLGEMPRDPNPHHSIAPKSYKQKFEDSLGPTC